MFPTSSRFCQLKSLNLSHNRLGVFPEVVCEILTLTELNLSCNGLKAVSVQIANLQRWVTDTGYRQMQTTEHRKMQTTDRYRLQIQATDRYRLQTDIDYRHTQTTGHRYRLQTDADNRRIQTTDY